MEVDCAIPLELKVPQCIGWGASSLPLIQEASVYGSLLSTVGCCQEACGKGDLLTLTREQVISLVVSGWMGWACTITQQLVGHMG